MPKADSVILSDKTYYAQEEVFSETLNRVYFIKTVDETINVFMSLHKISAAASNEAISLDEDSNTQETWLYDLEGASADDLTVKINGYSTAMAIKPLRVISGALSALTVSNSDASNPKYLGIIRIVPSSTATADFQYLEG